MHEGFGFIRTPHSESLGPAVVISVLVAVATVLLFALYAVAGEAIVDTLYGAQIWPSAREEFSKNGAIPSVEFYATAIERTLFYFLLVSGLSVLVSLAFSPRIAGNRYSDEFVSRLNSPAFRDTCIVACLLIVATGFRLPGMNLGIWRDEASTYFEATSGSVSAVITMVKYGELNPPGFYLVTHFATELLGPGEKALKISPLIFGLMAIPAAYFLARVAGSRPAGLIAATLVTISPVGIYYAQEARPNTLAALLGCLVTLFFLNSQNHRHRTWSLVAFVLSASLLIYVQYTGLMLLVSLALAAIVLVVKRRGEIPAIPYLIAGFAIFVIYLPWLPAFFDHLGTGTPWTPESEWSDQPRAIYKNVAYLLPWGGQNSFIAKATLGIATIAVLGALIWSVANFFRRLRNPAVSAQEETAAFVLGTAVLGSILMLAALSLAGRYMFSFIPIASALFGIWLVRAGRLVNQRGWRWVQPLPVAIVALFAWTSLNAWDIATLDRLPKSGIPAFASTIDPASSERVYLLSPDFIAPTFGYYTRDENVSFVGFARLEDPHIFRPLDYAETWSRDSAVEETIDYLRRKADEGYGRLTLIEGGICKELEDKGKMQYSRVHELRAEIDKILSPANFTEYPARIECVTVTEYNLTNFENDGSTTTGG
ncbi:glycosyltransferase family 39 protein [Ruegeria atlantica]|uniref:Putative membrane protein n=1 Tax=Ruegeria atlantica TaxID=81569 RepID=A0A0P1EMM9_9RHOB|nr:glycosyltransferase family 39 protein [Ruegeria atlantica]CUH42776.1 putative membrane protein [Ruegeria atlantica]